MTESPSELLTRAADRIRDLAAAATPAVWSAKDMAEHGHPGVWWVESEHQDADGKTWATVADLETCNPRNDAAWIAALSPAVAPHLQSILRATAVHLRMAGQDTRCGMCVPVLALARELLGEDQP